ncbi:hypothetical protein DSC88_03920 [Campylobacter upsaliensis]|nr:hypothetical protein [Campylobacter upsaliensis]EDP3126358.1 hypothetical protein [Campylobacter jejuni]EAL3928164.1 hypothetical protein [Campylobacter upsaliensis]EAL3974692.1 hypothetical protein [Campylobacter upsaliensis]EAL5853124.1 hypothetical protein [Campylobacter upsaliensis]
MTQNEVEQALLKVDLKENYNADLFDISVNKFTKDYEFIEDFANMDLVKCKESGEVFQVFFKQDDKVRLLRVSNMEAMDKFKNLKGAMTKIILVSGFKPD